MKRCPYCKEEIHNEAVKCKHCGSMLDGGGTDTLDDAVTERNQRQINTADTIGDVKTIFADQLYDGKLLAGQYRIVGDEPFGSGGMGEVWKATDTELATTVAIKVLPPMMARDKAAVENLKREAMIGQQLTHQNICRLYGFHSEDKLKFIVMEFIDGQTLKELLVQREDKKLTWQELELIARPVAEALDYAHSATYKDVKDRNVKGVLHRDIKPANIMITKDGQTKLMDFGIAREIHNTMTQLTGRSSSLTPMYASPEQFRGDKMTAASDIYSFTAVLYECLAGRSYIRPHGDLSYQVLQREFEPLASQSQMINKALEIGLAKNLKERAKDANNLVALLKTKVERKVESKEKPPIKQISDKPEQVIHSTAKPKSKASDAKTKHIGMKFVYIRPGKFIMGSPSSESKRGNDEGPQHRVKISKGFNMGVTEVTQAQYRAVMGINPSYFKGDKLPVENVSWNDAIKFCRKLSQKKGKTYRLPTEAEWEYACRAGTTTPFNTGERISTKHSNYNGKYVYGNGRKGIYRKKTTEVDSFPPNAFGLYDMHGNVWEGCQDWYDKNYYSNSPAVNPTGPPNGKRHVIRGGSWFFSPWSSRSAFRCSCSPISWSYDLGFRVVMEGE